MAQRSPSPEERQNLAVFLLVLIPTVLGMVSLVRTIFGSPASLWESVRFLVVASISLAASAAPLMRLRIAPVCCAALALPILVVVPLLAVGEAMALGLDRGDVEWAQGKGVGVASMHALALLVAALCSHWGRAALVHDWKPHLFVVWMSEGVKKMRRKDAGAGWRATTGAGLMILSVLVVASVSYLSIHVDIQFFSRAIAWVGLIGMSLLASAFSLGLDDDT